MQWIPKTEMDDIIELRFTAYAIIKSKKMMNNIWFRTSETVRRWCFPKIMSMLQRIRNMSPWQQDLLSGNQSSNMAGKPRVTKWRFIAGKIIELRSMACSIGIIGPSLEHNMWYQQPHDWWVFQGMEYWKGCHRVYGLLSYLENHLTNQKWFTTLVIKLPFFHL